jgi:hypothetical protein
LQFHDCHYFFRHDLNLLPLAVRGRPRAILPVPTSRSLLAYPERTPARPHNFNIRLALESSLPKQEPSAKEFTACSDDFRIKKN